MGDLIRTFSVDSTLVARVKRANAVSTDRIRAGDCLVGLSSTGKAVYETKSNSGIGSNGITLARHALIARQYVEKYPEIQDPALDPAVTYKGMHTLFEQPEGLRGLSVVDALLSPTRSYAPVVKKVLDTIAHDVHGIIHCTGGGQTKITRFGANNHYVKDNLFSCPPVFRLIQGSMQVPWQEMYSVFNMGHRMELAVPERCVETVCQIAGEFDIEARQIGYVEPAHDGNRTTIKSEYGEFYYS